jgi:serine/threonine-protein kinase
MSGDALSMSDDDDKLFRLLDAYLDDLQAGRAPAKDKLVREHPDLTPFLDCLDVIDRLATPGKEPVVDLNQTVDFVPTPSLKEHVLEVGDGFEKYELLGEIGRGGMGIVYKARQKDLDRPVAIKMILSGHLTSSDQVERFTAEARAMGRLQHPNIVRVHEIGQVHGQHYLVMEYLGGSSLADRVRHGPFDPAEAAGYVQTIARAVAYLHSQGIVHRDLKPSNILLDQQGQPFVTDFGLVKVLGAPSHATSTGVILGTPAYMAPEQAAARSAQVGPASDVYSLGVILYELLTGRRPFSGATPLETLVQVIEAEPPRPRLVNPKVPRDLEIICLKCLEKDAAARYASAEALADDLERFRQGEEVSARPPGVWAGVRRWTRREPALASRLVALAILTGLLQVNYQIHPNVPLGLHLGVLGVVALWATAALGFQRLLAWEWWPGPVRYAWVASDVVLLTALLVLTENRISPLTVGYPVLVAASGLWFRVPLVWFTTGVTAAAYAALIFGLPTPLGGLHEPHHHFIFLVALSVLGALVAYQVYRIRALSRYYENRPLP